MSDRALIAQLIAARRRRGLSQAQVARRMHVTKSAVGHLEQGRHSPTLATLARYATAVGAQLTIIPEPTQ